MKLKQNTSKLIAARSNRNVSFIKQNDPPRYNNFVRIFVKDYGEDDTRGRKQNEDTNNQEFQQACLRNLKLLEEYEVGRRFWVK